MYRYRLLFRILAFFVMLAGGLAWGGLMLIFNPRGTLEKESRFGSIYGAIGDLFPTSMQAMVMMVLGFVQLIIGISIIAIPAGFIYFNYDSGYYENGQYYGSRADSNKSDKFGELFEDEFTPKYPDYFFEYEYETGDFFVVNRRSTEFTIFPIYSYVVNDFNEEEIRAEIDIDFEEDIKLQKTIFASLTEYDVARRNLLSYFGDRFQKIEEAPIEVADQMQNQPVNSNPQNNNQMTQERFNSLSPEQQNTYMQQQQAYQAAQQQAPPLSDAEVHLKKADELWASGDTQTAMQHAQFALKIRRHHLGNDHEKVKELVQILQSASGN